MLSARRGLFIGLLMAAAMILQMLGLNLTSESVSAFLTALTILFVPLFALTKAFRSPSLTLWVGVIMATIGIWMLTGATPQGFGLGEVLGIGCAIGFTFYIFAVNTLVPRIRVPNNRPFDAFHGNPVLRRRRRSHRSERHDGVGHHGRARCLVAHGVADFLANGGGVRHPHVLLSRRSIRRGRR